MIDTLKQHEKTFQKFVDFIQQNHYDIKDDNKLYRVYLISKKRTDRLIYEIANDRELLSLLVEFCDSEGYYILPNINIIEEWYYEIELRGNIGEDVAIEKMNYGSRSKATQGAIKKCFELMEKNNR